MAYFTIEPAADVVQSLIVQECDNIFFLTIILFYPEFQ